MKYRIKEVYDPKNETTKFYPQYRSFGFWWCYTCLEVILFDVEEVKIVYNRKEQAESFIKKKIEADRKSKLKPVVKYHEIQD